MRQSGVIPEANIDYREDALWQRIRDFALDDSTAEVPYSRKLARENNWSLYHAHKVIEEYKRFCYLGTISNLGPSPSDAVDQAWHLHMLYTENYWNAFCTQVLGRQFHHHPSRGGAEERNKFRDKYERTLAAYTTTFGQSPPEHIWPSAHARYTVRSRFCRIDLRRYWVIPRLF